MLQSMGSQRVRHSLVTEQQLLQDQFSWGGSSLAVGRGEAPYLEGLRCGPLQRPTFHFPLVGGGGGRAFRSAGPEQHFSNLNMLVTHPGVLLKCR